MSVKLRSVRRADLHVSYSPHVGMWENCGRRKTLFVLLPVFLNADLFDRAPLLALVRRTRKHP